MKPETPQQIKDRELFDCLRFTTHDTIVIHGDPKFFVLVHKDFTGAITDFLAQQTQNGRLLHRTASLSSFSHPTQQQSEVAHLYCLRAHPNQIMVGVHETSGWNLQFDGAGIVTGQSHNPRQQQPEASYQYYLRAEIFQLNGIQIMRWEYPLIGKPKLKPVTEKCYWA